MGKEFLVLAEVVSEQWERLSKRTASENDLGSSVRDCVERGEALEHPHGDIRTEHGNGRAETDAPRASRSSRDDDLG